MKFEIEKDVLILAPDHVYDLGPRVGKELFPDLEQADTVFEESDPLPGFGEVVYIECENDSIFWIFGNRMAHGESLRQWNSLTYIHIMQTLSTGNFDSERFDISLSLCLNTGNKEGKATKGFKKLIVEAKGFSTQTTTKEGKR